MIAACGAVYHTAWVSHMNENGLGWPPTVTLDEEFGLIIRPKPRDAAKWIDSVTVISETVTFRHDHVEQVEVQALLPTLNIHVQFLFNRRPTPTTRHLASA